MLTADERAAMLARRRLTHRMCRLGALHTFNRERNADVRRSRARLLIGAVDLNHSDAAALCGLTEGTLRVWLYNHTSSTLWPPTEAQLKKLHYLCK